MAAKMVKRLQASRGKGLLSVGFTKAPQMDSLRYKLRPCLKFGGGPLPFQIEENEDHRARTIEICHTVSSIQLRSSPDDLVDITINIRHSNANPKYQD